MSTLVQMHDKISRSKEFNHFKRTVEPFCNDFGISQFYYCKIINYENFRGYITLGSNLDWHSHVFHCYPQLVYSSPIFHSNCKPKITLMNRKNPVQTDVLNLAWDKYRINFALDVQRVIPTGMESFGFGLKTDCYTAQEYLINHLHLLNQFKDYFETENMALIKLATDYQVDVSTLTSSLESNSMAESLISLPITCDFFYSMGFKKLSQLSRREIELVPFIAHGFPAAYIAKKLKLSTRTVENYIANIKSKFLCESRSELIERANALVPLIRMHKSSEIM